MFEGEILELNTEEPAWNPHDVSYARQESVMLDFEGKIIEQKVRDKALLNVRDYYEDDYDVSSVFHSVSNTLGINSFAKAIQQREDIDDFCGQNQVNICEVNVFEDSSIFSA